MTDRRDQWMWQEALAYDRSSGVPVPKHVKVDIDWGDQADPPWTEEEKEAMRRRMRGDYSAHEDADGNPLDDYCGKTAKGE